MIPYASDGAEKEIRMEDVSYTYPESDKVILDHAQMLVPVGNRWA